MKALSSTTRPQNRLLVYLVLVSTLLFLVQTLALRPSPGMSPKDAQNRRPMSSSSTRKTVYAIRHGSSTANEYMRLPGNQWGDPNFYDKTEIDTPLSETGRQQARKLLQNKALFESMDLVLVSPLRRCLQTYLEGVHPVCTGTKAVVLPLLRERVYTQSDTSSVTVQDLLEQYPSLDWSEAVKYDHPWHYTPSSNEVYEEWRPNEAQQWYATPGEPLHVFTKRMGELELWLSRRPETKILLVSHWGVIRHFTSQEAGNCQVIKFNIEGEHDGESRYSLL